MSVIGTSRRTARFIRCLEPVRKQPWQPSFWKVTLSISCADRRPSALAPKRPRDRLATHYPGHLLAEVAFEHRPPRNQREFPALLDQREPSARKIQATAINASDPLAWLGFGIGEAKLLRKLARNPRQFAPPQQAQQVGAVDDAVLLLSSDDPARSAIAVGGRAPREPLGQTRHRSVAVCESPTSSRSSQVAPSAPT